MDMRCNRHAGGIIETTALNPYRIRTFEIDEINLYSPLNGFGYLVAGRAVRLDIFFCHRVGNKSLRRIIYKYNALHA